MKTENQIWTDVRATILAGLADAAITDFEVIAADQPSKATVTSPTIWIDRISPRRYGWQGTTTRIEGEEIHQDETYYEEIIFQITAVKKRIPATDTAITITSGDAMNLLVSYFNGRRGIGELRGRGYGCLRVPNVRESAFISGSDLYEKTPSFDLTVTLMQTDEQDAVPTVDEYTITIEEVTDGN